jgi:hypothetical protein
VYAGALPVSCGNNDDLIQKGKLPRYLVSFFVFAQAANATETALRLLHLSAPRLGKNVRIKPCTAGLRREGSSSRQGCTQMGLSLQLW